MNRQFTFYRRLHTNEAPEVVYSAVEESLRVTVGGAIERYGNVLRVRAGSNNLNFAFVAEVNAEITLTQPAPGLVDIQGIVTLAPNAFFWICAVAGLFCLWFLWFFNVMYFVMDPRVNYQLALDRVQLRPADGLPRDPAYGA
jgi:hypothetical protein